jgi:hypothetical protein
VIAYQVEQGTEEWLELRAGHFTCSIAKKLVTPTGRVSSQYRGEIGRIIAEKMGWQEAEPFNPTEWMERGTDMEPEARRWFEVETGMDVDTEIGFIESEDGIFGFSPDGMVTLPDDLGYAPLELKCPKPSTHIGWLLEGELPAEHRGQVHFGMAMTNAECGYFMSYCPGVEPLLVRVERDDYTETMVAQMRLFADELSEALTTVTGLSLEEF